MKMPTDLRRLLNLAPVFQTFFNADIQRFSALLKQVIPINTLVDLN